MWLALTGSVLLFSSAHAGLVLWVDPASETLWLSGSATGTPSLVTGDSWYLLWGAGEIDSAEIDALLPTGFVDVPEVSGWNFWMTLGGNVLFFPIDFSEVSGEPGVITVVGGEVPYDYSELSSNTKAYLLSLASLQLIEGEGFGNIAVEVIPEASVVYSLLLGGGLLLAARRKRGA